MSHVPDVESVGICGERWPCISLPQSSGRGYRFFYQSFRPNLFCIVVDCPPKKEGSGPCAGKVEFFLSTFRKPCGFLVVCRLAPRSRYNRVVVESPLIEDVFVGGTRFLRMYIHCVWSLSRLWGAGGRASLGSLPMASLSATSLARMLARSLAASWWVSGDGQCIETRRN